MKMVYKNFLKVMKSWKYYSCESFLLVKSMQSFVFKKVFPNLNLLIWIH